MPENLSRGSSQNNLKPSFNHDRNKFPFDSHEFLTPRFGEATPFFFFDAEVSDSVPLDSSHDIQSYTLKSPLLSNFRLYKSYFHVPMSAILPRTWELIYTNPVQGDDVPADALCVTRDIPFLIQVLGRNVHEFHAEGSEGEIVKILENSFSWRLRSFLFLEKLLSYGGLPQLCRVNLRKYVFSVYLGDESGLGHSIPSVLEKYFQAGLDALYQDFLASSVQPGYPYPYVYGTGSDGEYFQYHPEVLDASSFRLCLSMLRENPSYEFNLSSTDNFDDFCLNSSIYGFSEDYGDSYTDDIRATVEPFNYSRLLAYQLSCAEFFTNQFIDPVYSAKLYRDAAYSFICSNELSLTPAELNFDYNGRFINYDSFSGKFFDYCIFFLFTIYNPGIVDPDECLPALGYLNLIFSIQRSLKKTDYFTSTKSRPLAVGDVNAPVVASNVSAVDVTRSIQIQRFLNSVNKVGRKFSDYVRGIFGGDLPADRHEPHFLVSQPFNISGFEVENTADDTGKRVTVLKSSDSRFAFSVDVLEKSIIVGIAHFELSRAYGDSSDRFFYHENRFDMFNPFMQFIGDQPVFVSELFGLDSQKIFSYQNRYQEYKQSFDHASGAFCISDGLGSYAPVDSLGNAFLSTRYGFGNITPDFIRSWQTDMDRFYSSLTGFSLATYFHFILSVQNNVSAVRSMIYRPNIL